MPTLHLPIPDRTPVDALAVAGAKGVWDSGPILLVVWTALWLYHVMNKADGYEALRQGIDDFGTPIVIVTRLLVAIGMLPVYAVAIPIIAHIWAKFTAHSPSGGSPPCKWSIWTPPRSLQRPISRRC